MRKILVKNIKGYEILAKSILSDMDTVLMPEGTVLRKSYAKKLNELNIYSVYIEDQISQGINEHEITEYEIKEQCQEVVMNTIKKYAYSGDSEFEKLKDVASNIIDKILSQPKIVYNISGVRQKSESIYAHSLNVCALSVLLAMRLNLPQDKIYEIAVGSVLHDIGYLNMPIEVIQQKDQKEYYEKHKKIIRMHVVYGYSIIENEKWISHTSKEIVLSHHELIDGTGYPMRVKGNKMKIGTKIVSICNAFDNLVYGSKSLKVYEAIEQIVALGGTTFDLDIVKLFNESVAAYPVGSIVRTNENEIGIVLRQNHKCSTRPVIRILKDSHGKETKDWIEKDLTKNLTLFINETLDDY